MNNARPVTRFITDSVHSLPWIRSSIALGRPYKPHYRFRKIHTSPRAALDYGSFAESQRPRGGDYEETGFGLGSDDPGRLEGESNRHNDIQADAQAVSRPFRRIRNVSRHWLVTSDDSCLDFGYEARVAREQESIQGRTVAEVYNVLRVAASEGTVASIFKVQACFNYLVRDLGEKPNTRLYSALILANCRADGSVAEVERLLNEMASEGLEMDIGVCHDVLKVLSVHPDYLLRTQMLQYMKDRWYSLTEAGHQDVVAGLIREGQLEFAMERMEDMKSRGMRILGWVYDMIIYTLVNRGELGDIVQMMRTRVADGDNISPTLWYYLLDTAARALHHEQYELASYIWKSRVQTSYLNPSEGICTNMMIIAQRNADVELVQQVFSFLGNRDTVFESMHYELVLETYINANMPEHGFYVLSAMQQANVVSNRGTTRRMYEYLRLARSRDDLERMFDVIKNIKENGGLVPVSAVNVLIEAATYHSRFDLALEMHKAISELCTGHPDLETYNLLLQGCRKTGSKNRKGIEGAHGTESREKELTGKALAFSLASEMVQMRIVPDAITYDRMMLICLLEDGEAAPPTDTDPTNETSDGPPTPYYEDGLRYYAEMRAKGFQPRFGSFIVLVRVLTRAGDERVWDLIDDTEGMEVNIAVRKLKEWVTANFGNKHVEIKYAQERMAFFE